MVLANGSNGLRSRNRNSIQGSAQHTLRRRTQTHNDAVGKRQAGSSRAGWVWASGKAEDGGLEWGRGKLEVPKVMPDVSLGKSSFLLHQDLARQITASR